MPKKVFYCKSTIKLHTLLKIFNSYILSVKKMGLLGPEFAYAINFA